LESNSVFRDEGLYGGPLPRLDAYVVTRLRGLKFGKPNISLK